MYLWIDNDEDPIVLQENWIKSGMTATAVTEIDTPNQTKQTKMSLPLSFNKLCFCSLLFDFNMIYTSFLSKNKWSLYVNKMFQK